MGVGRRIIELNRELDALYEKSAQDAIWCALALGNRLQRCVTATPAMDHVVW
jgi:hypothetical protein